MSERQDEPYVIVERRGSGLGAFLVGAICGAVAGILFAPRSGEETQRELREGALKLRVDAENKLHALKEELSQVYERAREDVSTRVEGARDELERRGREAREAVRVGTDAAKSARADLERRVAESKEAYRSAIREKDEAEAGEEPEEAAEEETEAAEKEA